MIQNLDPACSSSGRPVPAQQNPAQNGQARQNQAQQNQAAPEPTAELK